MIYLKPGVKVLPLPESVPPERFIGAGCGLPTAVHAIERAEIMLGDTVVVQGSGPVGLSALALAQLSGATEVIIIGAPPKRLEEATRIGADVILDIGRAPSGAHRSGAGDHPRARRRRHHRGLGQPQGAQRRVRHDARRRPLCDRGPVYRCGGYPHEPASRYQPQASGSARELGQRFQPFLARPEDPGQAWRALSIGSGSSPDVMLSRKPTRPWTTWKVSRSSRH